MSGSSNRKRTILWSPHKSNAFVVGSNDIRLYNILYKNDLKSGTSVNNNSNNNSSSSSGLNFDIEYPTDDYDSSVDNKKISLVSINSTLIKCMSWSPDPTDPNLIACGLTDGKAVLTSFSSLNRVIKEFSGIRLEQKNSSRCCHTIAWNPILKNQIACGFEKIRNDSSTFIWDINQMSKLQLSSNTSSPTLSIFNESSIPEQTVDIDSPHSLSQFSSNTYNTLHDVETITVPLREFTLSETTYALAWLLNNPHCLAVGTSSKWLKIHDTRDVNTIKAITAYPKSYVSGISVDPFDSNKLATYSDDPVVKIWDLRKFEEPVLQINTNYKTVQQMEYCPTRSGVIAASGKDKNTIKIWDIKVGLDKYSTISTQHANSTSSNTGSNTIVSNKDLNNLNSNGGSGSGTNSNSAMNHHSHLLHHQRKMSSVNSSVSPTTGGSSSGSLGSLNQEISFKPNKIHYSADIISSFSWHPQNECKMLTITYTDLIEVIDINESLPISWSPHGNLTFSYGKHLLQGPIKGKSIEPDLNIYKNLINDGRYNKDISIIIKERAQLGYSRNIDDNVNLSTKIKDENINLLWVWLQKIPTLIQTYKKNNLNSNIVNSSHHSSGNLQFTNDYIGIFNIILDKDIQYSTPLVEHVCGFIVFKSQNRFLCSTICGWGFGAHNPLDSYIFKLERNNDFEKAVAISIFHLEIKRAINTLHLAIQFILQLQQQSQSQSQTQQQLQQQIINKERLINFKVLSIALAGFGDNGNSNVLWRETCKMTAKQFTDPYLKSALEFLSSSDSKDILVVLEETQICLSDKISIATRYLDQLELCNYIERVTQNTIDQGNLEGIILTGLSKQGIDLLQNYIDKTGDIQTATLVTSVVVPRYQSDNRVMKWIKIYSDLLDNWELWHERAIFDIQRLSNSTFENINSSNPNTPTHTPINQSQNTTTTSSSSSSHSTVSSQIFAKCGFCQGSFSFESISSTTMIGRNTKPNTTKAKVPCCPHCRQALPKCCLCLLPLNCMVPTVDYKKSRSNIVSNDSSIWTEGSEPFGDWFTWCQTCRHGGHAQHLLDWFKEHTVCPVTDCICSCSSI